jgi:thiosulfate/3-mercaptopyruvate sulfurtransferase
MLVTTPTLVSADWLRPKLSDPALRVVDVRWYLAEPGRGRAEYLAGHIPGAVYLNIDSDLSAPQGQGPGRHPLPSAADFAATAGRAGIDAGTHVVAYDASGGAAAARLWWLLRYFGHAAVSLLDGGWPAWLAAGGASEPGEVDVAPALFEARPNPALVVDAAAVERLRDDRAVLLLDARATERYEGRMEPIDPRAGHIPGALSAPFAENLGPDGRFLPRDVLAARYAALGAGAAEQVVCYCGSGVTAAHNLLAMHLAGYEGLLYEGSWSDWSADPARPAAIGSEP